MSGVGNEVIWWVFYFSKTALEDVIQLKCKMSEAERRREIVLMAKVRISAMALCMAITDTRRHTQPIRWQKRKCHVCVSLLLVCAPWSPVLSLPPQHLAPEEHCGFSLLCALQAHFLVLGVNLKIKGPSERQQASICDPKE